MARRRLHRAEVDYGYFRIKVTASSVYINHRTPDPKYDLGSDAASTSITIEGKLDPPVIRHEAALVYVHGREKSDPGGAIGVNPRRWQVLVDLPRPQFADLMTLVAGQRLARVDLLTDSLRRGKGNVRSADFHTPQVPSEAEDDDAEVPGT
jgi:hypothetical protein